MNRLARSAAPASPRPVERIRSAENFPVALRVLPGRLRRHLLAIYGYARYVDDLGDEPLAPGVDRLAALDAFETELRDLYAGRPVHHSVLSVLAPTVAECRLPIGPLLRLIEANRVDQKITRYATFDQLVGYCELSANPVGELVLHAFGASDPGRLSRSDRVCTALQLIEHLQDVAEDHRRGRIYLPKADMDRFGVTEADLSGASAGPALRDLIRFEAERASAWLETGAPLVQGLRGWAKLAVGGYLAGGRATLDALAEAGHDPLRVTVRPRRRRILTRWLATIIRRVG